MATKTRARGAASRVAELIQAKKMRFASAAPLQRTGTEAGSDAR